MKSKTYVKAFIILICAALLLSAVSVVVLDPYFHFHAPWFGLQPILDAERYQNPGVASHFEYDSIIVGSSLSENFDAQWFNDGFNINAIKMTTNGASIEDIRITVEKAEIAKNHQLKYVFCNLENNMINHIYNKPEYDLPEYLYDDVLLNDVQYIFNKDVLFDCAKMALYNLKHSTPEITQAYQWYRGKKFSREDMLKEIEKRGIFIPESIPKVQQKPAEISENSINGIKVLAMLAEENPNTQFYYFYSPLSIVWWYTFYSQGNVLTEMTTLEYSMEQLLQYRNVHLFFPSTYEMITNLDNYKDEKHYSMDIQRLIFEQMRDGVNELTVDNYKKYIDQYQEMILNCDYEKIFK